MTKPKTTIIVNEEIHQDTKKRYFSVSGKIRNREFFRVGRFETKEEALNEGKILCGITKRP